MKWQMLLDERLHTAEKTSSLTPQFDLHPIRLPITPSAIRMGWVRQRKEASAPEHVAQQAYTASIIGSGTSYL